MVDEKEVNLEENITQKQREGLCMVPNDTSSVCNTAMPQWTNNPNANNCNRGGIINTEQYPNPKVNVSGDNLKTFQQTGEPPNYNGPSARVTKLSTPSRDSLLSPNRANSNEYNSNRSRLHLEEQSQGKLLYQNFIRFRFTPSRPDTTYLLLL